jgi:molybdopterin synthase sulfur carrier subunit
MEAQGWRGAAEPYPELGDGDGDSAGLTMPHVVISGQAAQRFTGGLSEFDVEANNFRRLVLELERRYPGLGHQVEEGMAVAIDGEIYQDAYLAPLKPDSEIYLIPKIGGG